MTSTWIRKNAIIKIYDDPYKSAHIMYPGVDMRVRVFKNYGCDTDAPRKVPTHARSSTQGVLHSGSTDQIGNRP